MFKPHKELGQNFLTDKNVAIEMVKALDIKNGEEIIEIGPGHGVLTNILLEKTANISAKISAVELDPRLYIELKEKYSGEKKIDVINVNILDWLSDFETDKNLKIIGSIPYYITSPIIHKIIKMKSVPETVVLLVQKEVAEKIKSTVPDSSYMSSFVQTFFDVKYLGKVPSKKFNPEPQVDGGILKMTRKDVDFSPDFIRKYEGFLHRAYSNPRKMLNKIFKQEELEKGKINPSLRAQNLGAEEWLFFYKILNEI
ncbi:16S rRNA (adenine(1518)-N(6)/adenine(1519)-N(6))-dimethyltransferase RsmA [Patescibacteria group bacterium]|nr:16S rRNA (adenine(1518)-N(6)/adenine(1519)-N(6))-dimethyltransferase RsmA [Patescibacteria group bacterium]